MSTIIIIIQVIAGLLLTALILLQSKGTGLGTTFGSDFSFYGTKRGAEKMLFIMTIVLSFIFLGTSLAGVILR